MVCGSWEPGSLGTGEPGSLGAGGDCGVKAQRVGIQEYSQSQLQVWYHYLIYLLIIVEERNHGEGAVAGCSHVLERPYC